MAWKQIKSARLFGSEARGFQQWFVDAGQRPVEISDSVTVSRFGDELRAKTLLCEKAADDAKGFETTRGCSGGKEIQKIFSTHLSSRPVTL